MVSWKCRFNRTHGTFLCFRIHKLQCQHAAIARATTRWVKTASSFLFLSSCLGSFVLFLFSPFLERFADTRGVPRLATLRHRKIPRERPEPVVRSIKIYACATPLQQACTLFWRQSRKRSPPPRRSFPPSSLQSLEKDWLRACTLVRWPPLPGIFVVKRSASSSLRSFTSITSIVVF